MFTSCHCDCDGGGGLWPTSTSTFLTWYFMSLCGHSHVVLICAKSVCGQRAACQMLTWTVARPVLESLQTSLGSAAGRPLRRQRVPDLDRTRLVDPPEDWLAAGRRDATAVTPVS